MNWWHDAGLDTFVGEEPRDWLAVPERPAPIVAEQPAAAAQPVVQPTPQAGQTAPATASKLPDTLTAFQSWLATSDSISVPLGLRVAPTGDPASGLMVLVDLPEAEDVNSGRLLSGAAGDLFDKMIVAMQRDRAALYLAAMAPGRPTGGFVDKNSGALFSTLARHHVALAKPRALLLMGEQPSRSFLNMGFVEARGRIHDVAIGDGAVRAVATFHPRTLLQHPQQKRRAWEDLQLLMTLLS